MIALSVPFDGGTVIANVKSSPSGSLPLIVMGSGTFSFVITLCAFAAGSWLITGGALPTLTVTIAVSIALPF